ncbi:hypothetical protein COOONC_25708 [Cooperia oncophora]
MMLKHFYRDGYRSRRTTIARAAAKLRRIKMGKTADSREKRARKMQTSKMRRAHCPWRQTRSRWTTNSCSSNHSQCFATLTEALLLSTETPVEVPFIIFTL